MFTYLPIHEPAVPKTLPEVPTEAWESIKKAEFEEVADAEVGECMKVVRKFSGKQKPRPNKRSRLAGVSARRSSHGFV